jgi:hypothetical protein
MARAVPPVSSLDWTSWPARERPAAAAAGALAVVGFGVAGWLFAESVLLGILAALALVAALQRFWFPVRCTVAADTATVRTAMGSRSMPLTAVRRVAGDGRAVMLASRSAPSAFDGLRAMVLPLPAEGGERLLEEIARRVADARGGAAIRIASSPGADRA